jgi:hypothetical protein
MNARQETTVRVAAALLGISCAAIALGLSACGTAAGSGLLGDAAVGATEFDLTCARCHAAFEIKLFSNLIVNNMGSVNPAMKGILLTDQQIADIRAFLAT